MEEPESVPNVEEVDLPKNVCIFFLKLGEVGGNILQSMLTFH